MDYDDGFSCGECPAGYTGSTIRGYDLQDAVSLQQVHTRCAYIPPLISLCIYYCYILRLFRKLVKGGGKLIHTLTEHLMVIKNI